MAVGVSVLIVSLAGAAAAFVLWACIVDRGGSRTSAAIFAVGWGALAFIPLAWGMFGGSTAWYVQSLGAYDYAGAIPLHLGAGVAALAIAILVPNLSVGFEWHRRFSGLQAALVLIVITVAWIAWLVLMELNLNELVIEIVVTSAILAAAAMVGSLAVQAIRMRRVSIVGVTIGVTTGLAAATATCAFLEPLAAASTGLVAGVVSGALAFRGNRTGMSSLAGIVALTNLSGAVVGLVMIGLLESGRGFFYTGAMTLSIAQVTAVVACLGYAALVSIPLGLIVGSHSRRAGIA